MANDKLVESREEKGRTYGDMVLDLGTRFIQDRKRFISTLNKVSGLLEGPEFRELQSLSRGGEIDSAGVFEDRFEAIVGAKDPEAKRELVWTALRHM
ncbi:MAG: hypothetical protein ACI8V2_001205 [Candidatus Latescibacterota bacterium]|jgi:hypothetical protein